MVNIIYLTTRHDEVHNVDLTFKYSKEIFRVDEGEKKHSLEKVSVWSETASTWVPLGEPVQVFESPEMRILGFLASTKDKGIRIQELVIKPGEYPLFDRLEDILSNPFLKAFLGI